MNGRNGGNSEFGVNSRNSPNSRIKKELVLDGLNCASCAAKIEYDVNDLNGVSDNTDIEKDSDDVRKEKLTVIRLVLGGVLFFTALLFKFPNEIETIMYLLSYIISGGDVLYKAVKNIIRGQVFDENFLMTIASIGAFVLGEYPEAVAVMLFYQIGELLQDISVNRSKRSISALIDIRPDYANVKKDDDIIKVSPHDVKVGDMIIVKPGEKIPLDGEIIDGNSMLDTSALTGEAMPREANVGDVALSGMLNINGVLTIRVEKEFGESTVNRILDMVRNASSKKAKTENFITKFAQKYTPGVVFAALILAIIPPLIFKEATFIEWIERALVFLVVSCPCALVISIPLAFFGGIGGASRNGILIKGSNFLEALNNVDTIVFDKTGTLTKGAFKVDKINTKNGIKEKDVLYYAALAESYSNHPIAASIRNAYGEAIDQSQIIEYKEISGFGVKALVKGEEIIVGNTKLMNEEEIDFDVLIDNDSIGTVVHVGVNGNYYGNLVITDEIKEDSLDAIKSLRKIGIKKLVMLTGDSKRVGEKIGEYLGLDEVYSDLLPDQKIERLEMLYEGKSNGKIVFVGDGINDAPVLARADVGVAMGALGSDAAIEAADIVLMNDEPKRLVDAMLIAKKTRNIVWQNIIFAFGVKLIVLILGAGGLATMWEAVFADVGVALLAVINSTRVLRYMKN